jgi:hypothetical protein
MRASRGPTIVVTGDVSIDWLLPSSAGETQAASDIVWMWGGAYACRALSSRGGAASHAAILRAAAATALHGVEVVGPDVPIEALASPLHPAYTHTFARIKRFPRKLSSRRTTAWRISEFLGSDLGPSPVPPAVPVPDHIDVLLVVDHDLGFRHTSDSDDLLATGPGAIVWQTGAPFTGSRLAETLLSGHADVLTVVTSSDELRKAGQQVGYALSWEQLTGEILAAVQDGPLAAAQRVIVVVGAAGAVIVERGADGVLVFDSRLQEGDWGKQYPGVGAGYGRCMDAAVTLGLSDASGVSLIDSVKRGLAAVRAAHRFGFVVDFGRNVCAEPFPLAAVARALTHDTREFADVVYRPSAGASILSQTYSGEALAAVAVDTALHGSAGLPAGIPVESAGAWASVDRVEIESVRSVRNIMQEYIEHWLHGGHGGRPLSVAVFGPPGAGKTFAVRQLATVLLPGQLRVLEFNLSQMQEGDLEGALHSVRDAALEGGLPLVFWDEFDAPYQGKTLGWLQHFLAPMEDGVFRDHSGSHPVGPAIFVFAGGTAARFQDFAGHAEDYVERAAKKPDFISRLGGYVDVTGPNRQNESDVAWPLRRALLLRSLITRRAPQMIVPDARGLRLEIDDAVLRAFLFVPEYFHGARSLAAIVQMCALSGRPRFERSSLPARHQLALHVDAAEFLALVRG